MAGGSFYRSYDGVNYTDQGYPATVSDFRLDKYEVTVGRFRKFVAAWDGGWRPAQGAGKHTHLNGGKGLLDSSTGTTYEPGWETSWSSSLATAAGAWDTNLMQNASNQTWTASPGSNENRPINYETWYEAYAFCIWDGGFLPSEAEWNYAAAGGSEQRVYPWSNPASSTTVDCSYANYSASWPGTSCQSGLNNVGSESPKGDGKWGQSDLGGNAWEWNLDWFASPYTTTCNDCAYLGSTSGRVDRGGSYHYPTANLLVAYRGKLVPTIRVYDMGFRCARVP